jgi:hypothetical protein
MYLVHMTETDGGSTYHNDNLQQQNLLNVFINGSVHMELFVGARPSTNMFEPTRPHNQHNSRM